MITSTLVYNGVNFLLAIACLLSVILMSKFVPDKRARTFLVIACILIIVSSGALSLSLRIFKLAGVAYVGEAVGEVEKGTYAKVDRFKNFALMANVLELVAVGLFVGLGKKLVTLHSGKS